MKKKFDLLCIDGPAGSGKSTLCNALALQGKLQGFNIKVVSEFSPTPFGYELTNMLANFAYASDSNSAMEEMIYCVADKMVNLLTISKENYDLIVIDRGFITQAVLALPLIEGELDHDFSFSLISLCNSWLSSRFNVKTMVLQLPEFENFRRLEHRLQRDLTIKERQIIRIQIERYRLLHNHPDSECIGLTVLNSEIASKNLAKNIVKKLFK